MSTVITSQLAYNCWKDSKAQEALLSPDIHRADLYNIERHSRLVATLRVKIQTDFSGATQADRERLNNLLNIADLDGFFKEAGRLRQIR